jgi:lysyl-tRNA synthetase class 2
MSERGDSWRPTATRAVLQRRAQALAVVREFFAARSVLEVDTPVVVNAPVTDVHIHSAEVRFPDAPGRFYLHTSPEFAMKRLLASGSGDLFQICHVARGLERGRHHNAEFTLIEWYRLGFSLDQLMDEVDALARTVLGPVAQPMRSERSSYVEAFKATLGIDPLAASLEELRSIARAEGLVARRDQRAQVASPSETAIAGAAARPTPPDAMSRADAAARPALPDRAPADTTARPAPPDATSLAAIAERDELLEFLMGVKIGPRLGRGALTFVHRYPASQAALARLDPHDSRVALRFELYCEGIELANGFHELASASEQRARFEHDLAERRARGLPTDKMDELLLSALEAGLPECAGVAVGFDRLLMVATGATHIDQVMPFPIERA